MKQPDNMPEGTIFMDSEEFEALPGGQLLSDSTGRIVVKIENNSSHHTEFSVFDPSDGTICHYSWFNDLRGLSRFVASHCSSGPLAGFNIIDT